MVTKVIHEFGHGLTCKHFGGECHEMGVMLLVLTPCLYCNVSDSWMLPNKWHRAVIGAAGMYVELVIASICTFVWWFSEPGLLNQLCLSTMFVCSVSTVMFNANPLLRYDGYYILSRPAWRFPTCGRRPATILSRKLGAWCLGLEEPDDPFLPQRQPDVLRALHGRRGHLSLGGAVLDPVVPVQGLRAVPAEGHRPDDRADGLYGLVVQPLWKVGKFFLRPGEDRQVKKPRMYGTLAVVAAWSLLIVFLPLPYHVMCTLEVKPEDAASSRLWWCPACSKRCTPGRPHGVEAGSGRLAE